MKAFCLEPSANTHFDEIYDYTSARWDEDQADRYIEALFEEFAAIADRRNRHDCARRSTGHPDCLAICEIFTPPR